MPLSLAKQSWRLLAADLSLLVFPLLSGIACFAVLLSFVMPVVWSDSYRDLLGNRALGYGLMFAFYFLCYFAITFFNAALAACVIEHFRGGQPTVMFGLHAAAARLPQIVAWAALAATVGFILRLIEERVRLVGRLIAA